MTTMEYMVPKLKFHYILAQNQGYASLVGILRADNMN